MAERVDKPGIEDRLEASTLVFRDMHVADERAGSYTSTSVRQTLKSPAIRTGRPSATSSGTRSEIASRKRSLSANAGAPIA